MGDRVLKCFISRLIFLQSLRNENGQDLVEYALIAGLIALGAVASMQTLAGNVATGFTNIGTKFAGYTS